MTTITFKKMLHCTTSGSDKIYIVQVEAGTSQSSFEVCGFNGRRGSTLTRQMKGTYASALAAQGVADNLVKEKLKKGYKELVGSPAPAALAQAGTAHADDEVASLAAKAVISLPTGVETVDDIATWAWRRKLKSVLLQQKMDGERVQCVVQNGRTMAWSRNRKPIVIQALPWMPDGLCVDAELIDGELHPFQIYGNALVETNELGLDFLARHLAHNRVGFTELAVDENFEAGLTAFGKKLALDGAEGFIIRDPNAGLKDGRDPAVLKLKFTATADVMLEPTPSARVAGMMVWNGKSYLNDPAKRCHIGDVTLPVGVKLNGGEIAEVRYLYKTQEGKLQQPVFLRMRDDLDNADCTLEKLTRIKGKSTNWGGMHEATDVIELAKGVVLEVDTRW